MKAYRFFLILLLLKAGVGYPAELPVVYEAGEPMVYGEQEALPPEFGEPTSLGEFENYPPLQREKMIRVAAEQLSDSDLAHWAETSKKLNAILQPILKERKDRLIKYWSLKQFTFKLLSDNYLHMGHSERVNALTFSRDGSLLASCSTDGTVKLWDGSSGDLVKNLLDILYPVYDVKFSPDKLMLASVSDDQTLRRWTIKREKINKKFLTVEALKPVDTPRDNPQLLAFSTDGKLLSAAGVGPSGHYYLSSFDAYEGTGKGRWKVWEPKTISFSTDGATILAAGNDLFIDLIDITKARDPKKRDLIDDPLFQYSEITTAVFSPGKKILALGHKGGTITLWDVKTGVELRRLQSNDFAVSALAFSPFGNILAFGLNDRTIRIWDVKAGAEIGRFDAPFVTVLEFSPDGKQLASGDGFGHIRFWKPKK